MENYSNYHIQENNFVILVKEKEELIKKSVDPVKDKEWLLKCKC